jgi:hypothetical protein
VTENPQAIRATYVGTKGVRIFFGGKSAMWIWRKLKNDPRFPKPVYFGKLPHWRVDWLELYAAEAPTTPSQGVAS